MAGRDMARCSARLVVPRGFSRTFRIAGVVSGLKSHSPAGMATSRADAA